MHRVFGQLPDGTEVHALTLRSDAGLEAEVLTYGGILHTLRFTTAQGVVPLVLNLPDLPAYAGDGDSLNILVGRFGNRIAGARYTLDGVTHALAANEGRNHLHGGLRGFGRRVWSVLEHTADQLLLGYDSPDGEEGYPGNLQVRARLALHGHTLQLDLEARCDAATPLNLTHHPYFNLSGDPQLRAASQVLRVPADRYLPVDAELIPTGEVAAVAGTPFDFRTPAALAERIDPAHPQIVLGQGYDQCLILAEGAHCVAELYSPQSGVAMRISSDAPAVQLYEGQHLDAHHPGLGRGICLEPQDYPDAPNQPHFPSTILRPGEVYHRRIAYRFANPGPERPWEVVSAALDG
ncbi:aldose epimerase family protein [Xanthomonas sp. NCPPB 1638]|uniref:aldose epimerase family protein n=1 Tax=Xanthomonas TaxID=338 RepID=UPI00132F377D|nr:aldose epimerase family protein [Xanthomonas cucurbitae]QHG86488.1 galactose mutarotase [Xanthomonas cucurbitae]WDM76408.1 galactose mutarotase [Xanthomonas cucurbitae]